MMNSKIGQKVVCVDDRPSRSTGIPTTVKAGEVYTIISHCKNSLGRPGVCVAEVAPPPNYIAFDVNRFRPLVDKSTKTGMAILKEILERETVVEKKPEKAK